MSLTASAPPSVESDIKSSLALRHPVVISRLLNRSDIYMSVVKISSVSVISIITQFTDGMPDWSVLERFCREWQLACGLVQTLVHIPRL